MGTDNRKFRKTIIGLGVFPIVAACLVFPRIISAAAPTGLSGEQWAAKIHAGWLGKVAAGSGALPTEMWQKENIRKKYGILTAPPQKPTPRGPLDDTTLAFLGWRTAREKGKGFTTVDIAREWADHLTDSDLKGGGFGREFIESLHRIRKGEQPPFADTSPRGEWIAAQMRAEIWGMLAPGDPVKAAEYAARDAGVFNRGNGIYAAQFVAATAGMLMVDPDIPRSITAGLNVIPKDCTLAGMIRQVVQWHRKQPDDWERTWEAFVDTYRDRSFEHRLEAWSPDWLVETGGWPEAEIIPEYQGGKNILRTHPFSETEPALLSTNVTVPRSGGKLILRVTCNTEPPTVDWLLRVRIGDTVTEEPIRRIDGNITWQEFTFDLKPWAGTRAGIVLENAVLGKFAWEAGFWNVPEIVDGEGKRLRGEKPANRPCRYPVEFTPKILPETFSVLIGLLYGNGDFRSSVSLATLCGFDTDCNAGTVGCLLGIRNGLDAIPPDWKDPVADTYELQVTGFPRTWNIGDLAFQIMETGMSLK
jgi:ADP-ribosylglycohydrolase